jgi:TM2 domain-containing membrane protein YozV
MAIWLPTLVMIIGALIYGITENAKAQALAKDLFWTGLLVTLLLVARTMP